VFVTSAAAERIAETVEFFPATSNMPRTSSADAATKAASNLIHALQNPAPAAPFAALGDRQQQALEQLANIFANSVSTTPASPRVAKNFIVLRQYMKMPIALIPEEIIEEYNLQPLVHHGFVYIEIQKGMYGLPQAGILASKLLQKRLAAHGYAPTDHTHGLWKHHTRPILFSLVVDDFCVKYVGKQHADHLYNALEENYEAACD
jgi:hypothetical protein